ncbi:MucBP domain-containing protein [Pediococcus ethanolidurans]|uniref:mucin-binding protein n=1 Tax=Pediococcus ethanolidurans TaxID=319653 RepID=UPI001C1EE0FC|nr:MucBP domain-containing protein [Pediococcus ethanolidurans]MCV3328060.1 MucBP domain-containing protein [Pediococcus ethanolidurans]
MKSSSQSITSKSTVSSVNSSSQNVVNGSSTETSNVTSETTNAIVSSTESNSGSNAKQSLATSSSVARSSSSSTASSEVVSGNVDEQNEVSESSSVASDEQDVRTTNDGSNIGVSIAKSALSTQKLQTESSALPSTETQSDILNLNVILTDQTETNTDGTISVTSKIGTIGSLTNVYAVADYNQVRNMNNQMVMAGNAITNGSGTSIVQDILGTDSRLVMCYDAKTGVTTFALVDGEGKILTNDNGIPLTFNFSGTTRTPEVREQVGGDLWIALNYGGANVDVNFGEKDGSSSAAENDKDGIDWIPGELFSIPNSFSIPVSYVDADTGNSILPTGSATMTTGSQYTVSAETPPVGYELVGVLKGDTTPATGVQINDSEIDKTSSSVYGTVQNDLDNNFMANYYITHYLSVGATYHLTLQDYGPIDEGNFYELTTKPIDLQITRLNEAGDIELIYTDSSGDQEKETINHDYTQTISNSDDFWTGMENGGAGNNLRSIHNTMNLSTPDEITFVYRKIGTQQANPVIVNYVDQNGAVIFKNVVLTGIVGDTYQTTAENIVGYTLSEVQGNPTGTFTDQTQTITYVYKLNENQTTETMILGVPVEVTTTINNTDDGSSATVTSTNASISGIAHDGTTFVINNVYAIADFNEVRTITNQKVMDGAAIANAYLIDWVKNNLENNDNTRFIFSYDPENKKTTLTLTDEDGNVLALPGPSFDPISISFTPNDLKNSESGSARSVVQVGWNLFMSVSYGGDNLDVNFADRAFDSNGVEYLDWNPGELFSIPNQSTVNVKYVDKDTGKTILPDQTIDISTGNTYVTKADEAPTGYILVGKLDDGTTVTADQAIDDNTIEYGVSSSSGIYTPDYDQNFLSNYTITRNIAVGQSYSTVLQDYIPNPDFGFGTPQMIDRQINMVVTRLDAAGDIEVVLTDLTTHETQKYSINCGDSVAYSNTNDFWNSYETNPQGPGYTVRIIRNELNLNPSANVVYVYEKQFVYGYQKVTRTINYTGAGEKTPASVIQTVTYNTVTNRLTGETSYTPVGVYGEVISPVINGYKVDQESVDEKIPNAIMTAPNSTELLVTYTPVINYGEVTTTRTINYIGAGNKAPAAQIQTIIYKTVTNEATGQTSYTPTGIYAAVNSPDISGYTVDQKLVNEVIPTSTLTIPTNSVVTVTYSPIISYGKINVTRTIKYVGAGSKTPQTQIQTIIYNTVTNEGTGETSYTPTGVYNQVESPEINGYTVDQKVVPELIPVAALIAPSNSTVTVTYSPIIEYGRVTTTRTIKYVGAGSKTPQTKIQTVVYNTVTNEGTGETSYTPTGVYDEVISPVIDGYTVDKKSVPEVTLIATLTAPSNSIVTVTYSPIITYGEVTTTRTIKYIGAGSKTPQTQIQTIIYNTVTNEGTGETSYTPTGIYAKVNSPEISGYLADQRIVPEVIPSATLTVPTDSEVTVVYSPIFNYGQVIVTRTIKYVGGRSKTPKDRVQKVTYNTVTNEGTGETSYTPTGVYDEVISPVIDGYTVDQKNVAEEIPISTLIKPADKFVIVTYTLTKNLIEKPDKPGKSETEGGPSVLKKQPSKQKITSQIGAPSSKLKTRKQASNLNKKQVQKTEILPQTNEQTTQEVSASLIGMLLVLFGLAGVEKRKKNHNN